jgi:surface polysaccharide O-acyltransferase-like enzyme
VEARQSLESQRNGGIDALRAAVTLLVVLHHTAIAYGAEGGWYYRETAPNSSLSGRLLVLFCTTNQAWFMGFFFLLAGYYTPPAFERRGAAAFLKSRWLRLGTPLLFYALAIHPVVVALAQTAHDRPFAQTLLSLWSHARFEPGPLWFAEALLIFAALYVAWRLLTAKAPRVRAFPSNLALLTAALAAGAAAFGLRLIWPVGVNVGFLQLGYFSGYVVLFWAGCLGSRGRWLENIPPAQQRLWLRVAWLAFPLFPAVALFGSHTAWLGGRAEGGINAQALVYAFWEPFVAWGFILGALASFERRVRAWGSIWRALSRRAYLIYIIHPLILVAVSLAWRSIAAPALVKFAVTGSASCLACYLAAGALLRVPGVAKIV